MWIYQLETPGNLYTLKGLKDTVSEAFAFESVNFYDWFKACFASGTVHPIWAKEAEADHAPYGTKPYKVPSTKVEISIKCGSFKEEYSFDLLDALFNMANCNGIALDDSVIWDGAIQDELRVEFSTIDGYGLSPSDYALECAEKVLRNRGLLK